ncbi:MAG: tRNA pseudouridine(38-40) synthase TruA [Prochlorococcus sp.]|jgi:tRNA pseudouridine38-40 synthase|nr:tRNA pseudouridine(38-40) synthase TruA [Prochlorococcaceae cyanobacterium ETNP18_MAG_14]MDP6309807.1 tRNA pseudouridine(38-40) synthase TruA [Prochlorococcaceae cyanobacterium ETNP14_MAG_4]HJM81044.1 tRNA pseudouridine(38-40) synthase TruA [Prochlorococcaceae cyanobacterium Fu_MAG_72]|tara:strand:+ start:1291 stop:2169 length:879 start_codon:yes stop_codon:yes gene_type:complete
MSPNPTKEVLAAAPIRRIGLSLQYEGSGFCGWQRQPHGVSVQGELEEAISQLDPLRPIQAVAAGRTDAGVHAAGQVVHFDCSGPIPAERWAPALNGRLPKTIRVREAVARPSTWHACHSATYRRYRYTIYNGRRPNLFLAPWSWHRYNVRLDETVMKLALKGLLGLNDLSAFQRTGSRRAHARTTVQAVQIERQGDLLVIEIQASGFLYGMVRLLTGQLVALGEHRLNLETFERRWKEKRRQEVKEAAPAQGLCLLRAGYKEAIFSKSGWYDCQPRYYLETSDPPSDPPLNS